MADVRIHLTAGELDELGEMVDALRKAYGDFEDGDNADPHEFYSALGSLADNATGVLEWVSSVRVATANKAAAA